MQVNITFRDARTAISRIGSTAAILLISTQKKHVFFLLSSTGSSCFPVVFQLMLVQIVTILTGKKRNGIDIRSIHIHSYD